MDLTALYSAAGLSAAAGARAFLLLVALGVLHHTPWFTLSEGWAWLASPVVLSVLGALAAVEIALDMHPDLAEFGDWAGYPTRIVSGFLVAAAWTGSLHPDLQALASQGVLTGQTAEGAAGPGALAVGVAGALLAGVVHLVRSRARNRVRAVADATDPVVDKAASITETTAVAGMMAASIWAPTLVPLLLLLAAIVAGLVWWKGDQWSARRLERRRKARAALRAGTR